MEKVVIFGRGKYFRKKYASILKNYEIVGFLDNSVEVKEYDEEFRCEVYNPIEWEKLPQVNILCMSIHFIDMWKQLISLGVIPERIRIGTQIAPFYNEIEKYMYEEGKLCVHKDFIVYHILNNSFSFSKVSEYKEIVRNIVKMRCKDIGALISLSLDPISRNFGGELGTPIDRFYIESFLEKNKHYIKGTVMEIGGDGYIRKYGENRVQEKIIIHVDGINGLHKANLETGEGLQENMVDCFICTQTLFCTFELKQVVENIYKLLKPDGVALITVPGLVQIATFSDEQWGDYWRFTKRSLERLFKQKFSSEKVDVHSYGNIKVVMAALYGISTEMMNNVDFKYSDNQYSIIVSAIVKK